MRKHSPLIILLVVLAFIFGTWHTILTPREDVQDNSDAYSVRANAGAMNFSDVKFTPWDIKAAAANLPKQAKKPYTIMIYMNGSDLESENGAATDDLIEILESGVDTANVNIVLFTGGTNRWQNNVIPDNNCMLWKITGRNLEEIAGVGLVNMGDAGTLSSFIDFSVNNFPASKYGLIMWDHGGGSIAGYGQDEKFMNSALTLREMNYAFHRSALSKNKLEFLGFDSCLMATAEMAVVGAQYAKYLVASEDLEPGAGWDYSFLEVLNGNPQMGGADLGIAITDYFMDFYGEGSDEILTMSVTDLSGATGVMDAIGQLMNRCSVSLQTDRLPSFRTLAKKRGMTKTFGVAGPRDSDCDMVDIGDMAHRLSDVFPSESAAVIQALDKAVIYNRHNSDTDLKGLSAYYIYGGKDYAEYSLDTYSSLNMDKLYTDYLHSFAGLLISGGGKVTRGGAASGQDSYNILENKEDILEVALTVWRSLGGNQYAMVGIQNNFDLNSDLRRENINLLWPAINKELVPLHEIGSAGGVKSYAVPASVNGEDCDIVVIFSDRFPNGKIRGYRKEDGIIIQKGFDTFKDGDRVAIYYGGRSFPNSSGGIAEKWHMGEEFTVNGELELEWNKIDGQEFSYSVLLTDIRNDKYFSDLY